MSYAMINEKLNLKACNVSDLTQQIKDDYTEQFTNDSYENMTFFYLADSDTIILNKDHANYEFNAFLVENYLEFDEKKRIILREQSPESIKDTIHHIDLIINHRMQMSADLVDNKSNVMPLDDGKEEDKEEAIILDHGERTTKAVKAVSDYIKGLPLDTIQNDTLISLLKDQLLVTEHEAFMQGFVACMDVIQGCGLNAAMDKVVKSTDINE